MPLPPHRPASSTPWFRAVCNAAFAACTLAACASPESDAPADAGPRRGGVLRFAISEVVKCLDTVQYADRAAGAIAQQYFENLVFQDREGRIHPWLATSWTRSDDGLVYTFEIRRDKAFTDGTPLDAAAVKRNIDYILESTSWTRISLLRVQSAQVIDDHTVAIRLFEPDNGILEALADPIVPIQSPAGIAQGAKQNCLTPSGTGPFKVESFDPQSGVVFVRNPDFAEGPPGTDHRGPAHLDRIDYRFITDNAARLAALQSGAVDAIEGANVENGPVYDRDPSITLLTAARKGIADVFFLNRTRDPWKDERVRKAFIHAVDIDTALRTAFFGRHEPLYSPLSSSTTHHTPYPQFYRRDVQLANRLLDDAGWTGRDAAGYRTRDGVRLESSFKVYASEIPAILSTVQQAQESLKAIGFRLDIEQLDAATSLARGYAWDYGVTRLSYSKNSPDILRALFHSESAVENADGSHRTATPVLDGTLDGLLARATATPDEDERRDLYQRAQHRLGELGVLLPITDQQTRIAHKDHVHGLKLWPASNYVALYDVWLSR